MYNLLIKYISYNLFRILVRAPTVVDGDELKIRLYMLPDEITPYMPSCLHGSMTVRFV